MNFKSYLFMFSVIVTALILSQLDTKWSNIILMSLLIILLGILAYLKIKRNDKSS